MKKLLSLLSVLTISGTAVPTTIAASPYKKQETKNSDINYQQINNLENLNRNKRQFGAWGDEFDDATLWNSAHNNRKINISLLRNINADLGSLLHIDARNILQAFLFNNTHLNTLENRGERLISYLRVGNINTRAGRATLYTERNNYFEGTITVVWSRNSSGDKYPNSTPDFSSNGHIEL
ncbi:hypothetical protein [Spiroplasma endosymbiont of Megaselia nigra]|uniref:hypothetical protein n=1 Tax=Spiroplasma endosymbiont of Megaselia nigra TaxID=2478537 RepID=UPI000F86BEC6|nr:hypothetical protein [Spiroplasma endosymbiont of Megaselia nigra]RUO86551.1 hypothetical protein D9R21_02395 [Spiroplasma endosymbiont of Megaselia nigra]